MTDSSPPVWQYLSSTETPVETAIGRTHYWYCKPGMVQDTNLVFVKVQMQPDGFHSFHYHPHMEEILYVTSGTCEQWVDAEKRILKPGDSVYLPAGLIHGTYNAGPDVLEFLAILTPAKSPAPGTVQVCDQEPWKSMRQK